MNRGANRIPIFLDRKRDRIRFKRTLGDAVRLWKIRIHAYALMDNHYHLLLETPLGNLSRAMRHIDGVYTQRINRVHGRDGPLLRGRFKSILIQKESYFTELVRYIHLNGVKAGHFASPRHDFNCSHPDYLFPDKAPSWLEQSLTLSFFEGNENDPRQELDEFVTRGNSPEMEKTLSRKRWPAILGPAEFAQEIKARFKLKSQPIQQNETPQLTEVLQQDEMVPPEKIIQVVCDIYNLPPDNWTQEIEDRKNSEARWVMMNGLRTLALQTYPRIGQLMNGLSADGVEKYLKRWQGDGQKQFADLKRRLGCDLSVVGT